MRLTTKGRFAVTAMIDLGLNGGERPVTLSAISERQNISLSSEAVGLGQAERQQLEAQAEARKVTGGAPLANNPPPKTMTPAAAPNALTGRGGAVDAAMLPDQIQTMPPRPAKVTPPTAKPAAGDTTAPPVSMLKNGVNTTFENGQVWTLKNGVATRIK